MISNKTTQTLVIDRYSRILVPLPPVQSIKGEVKNLVEDSFKTAPEFVETDWCEGYAISWRSWYGFEDNMRYPSMRSFFPLRLKRIIDDWLNDEEDMQVIEWIDEERWNWLSIVENYDEIFQASYPHKVRVYSDFLTIGVWGNKWRELRITDFDALEELKKLYPVFRVFARRGYWNLEELIVTTRRDEFYKKIGFKFETPFQT